MKHVLNSVLFLCVLFSLSSASSPADSLPSSTSAHSLVLPPLVLSDPPAPTPLERSLFLSTWWGYHAAFVADFTVTGMILDRGGHEGDPLYTAFGDRSMAGVIGSAVVFHAAASLASYELYRAAQKRHGAWRVILNAASLGINGYFIGIHTWATVENVKTYKGMK